MDIKFNEADKALEIKDGLRKNVFLIKFLMILNLINSVLNLSDLNSGNFGFIKIIWTILGAISIVILYKFIVKKSSLEKVPIDQIKGLKERIFMGRKKYFLELTNGKNRDLLEVKSESDFKQLKKMLQKNDIQV